MPQREALCLRVWFYDPRDDPHCVVNKLVASLDGPFCHCEVQFPDVMAFSVYMGVQANLNKVFISAMINDCLLDVKASVILVT